MRKLGMIMPIGLLSTLSEGIFAADSYNAMTDCTFAYLLDQLRF